MNPQQMKACAGKLPPDLAREFERLHAEADALLSVGWRLRQQAWALYRDHQRRRRR